jgi:CubicO group peptidase (beta-lactamase class C family)
MKTLLFTLILFFTLYSADAQRLTDSEISFIDSLLNATYKQDEPGAVVLVAKNGNTLFRKAYGLANVELDVPNQPTYVFRIGSMTKQFTAVCILKLAEEGKLTLGDDIRKYLPEYNTHGRLITVENLLTHCSGITSYTEKSDFYKNLTIDQSKDQMTAYFMNDSLLFEPGKDWSYSNSGYVLAGLIVEKVSGMALSEYLKKQIFDPLTMYNTFTLSNEQIIPGAVTGYEGAGKNLFKPAGYLSWTWPYAAGDILSTVDDLLKWEEALISGKILGKDWLNKAWTSHILPDGQKVNYGYGWSVGEYKGLKIISHGGAINGFLSDGIIIPSKDLFVVILSNRANISPAKITSQIAMNLSGFPVKLPEPIKMTTTKLNEYSGVYEVHRVGSRITTNSGKEKMYRFISVVNDTLMSQRTGGSKTALIPTGEDTFCFSGSNNLVRFHRDSKGKVISLEIYSEPVNYGPNELEPKTDLQLPNSRIAIQLNEEQLAKFKGKYDFGGGLFMDILLEAGKLYLYIAGQDKVEMHAESELSFFFQEVDASITFQLGENNRVTGMIFKQGVEYTGTKIE